MRAALTKQQWLDRFHEIHGDKYEYYEIGRANTIMKVFCKKHQKYFKIKPSKHYAYKQGCPLCSAEEIHQKWLNQFHEIHGDKYEYPDQINSSRKIEIKCKKCNYIFLTSVTYHARGQGCPQCNSEFSAIKRTKKWIEKFRKVHGDKYEYPDFITSSGKFKIKIYCNNCKKYFYQRADNHLNNNCPHCRKKRWFNNDKKSV